MKNLLLTIILFSQVCCKKQPKKETEYIPFVITCNLSSDLDTIKQSFNGTWEFVQEKRVERIQEGFYYLTPQSQGYNLRMQIIYDTVKYFRNTTQDSVYRYKILKQADITGTNNPDDNEPVLVFYNTYNGLRNSYVPIKSCGNYLILQFQAVTSIVGEQIWKKL